MKKLVSAALAVIMLAAVMTGCGAKEKNRILFRSANLSKCIELGEYMDIPVDTASDTYKGFYEDVINADVENNGLYVRKTEGAVADGDTANIDYIGKKDGVAFEGGTDKGYDLTIGSDSFIDGFEDGLIGVAIGDTVDLNLTFPENYGNEELNGAAVVFTVTVNYVTTDEKREPADYYTELDFESLEAYEADAKDRAIKNYLLDTIMANSKVKDYPQEDIDIVYESFKGMMENQLQSSYGIDFETYLSYSGMTEDDVIEEQIKPILDSYMLLYAIMDEEDMKIEQKEVTQKLNATVKEINNSQITADYLNEYYGEYYFEAIAVNDKVLDYLYDNAKIK